MSQNSSLALEDESTLAPHVEGQEFNSQLTLVKGAKQVDYNSFGSYEIVSISGGIKISF